MNEERHPDRPMEGSEATGDSGSSVIEQAESIVAQAVVVEPIGVISGGRQGHYPSREGLDREMRAIKDEVLRMGSLVASQIGIAIEALVESRCGKGDNRDRGRRSDQRSATTHQFIDHDDHRDATARGARPAVHARTRPRDL